MERFWYEKNMLFSNFGLQNVSFDKVICLWTTTLKKILFRKEKNSTFFPRDSTSKKFLLQPKKYKCSMKQHNKREDTITTYCCLCVTYIKGTSVLLTSMNAHFFVAWFSALFSFMYKWSKFPSANFAVLLRQIKCSILIELSP